MPDTTTPPTPPPAGQETASPHRPPGYFNQAQLADITVGEEILREALRDPYKTQLAGRDIDAAFLQGLGTYLENARQKMTETGQDKDQRKAANLQVTGAERTLIQKLQGIQAAAKQKHRMLEEDGDPATNLPLDGYLIGKRLNPNRQTLLQNADALLARAKADHLPGYKTDADLKPVTDARAALVLATGGRTDVQEEADKDRLQRDDLIHRINARRLAIQHAVDALHPYTEEASAPIRKIFKLSLDRPFNG